MYKYDFGPKLPDINYNFSLSYVEMQIKITIHDFLSQKTKKLTHRNKQHIG